MDFAMFEFILEIEGVVNPLAAAKLSQLLCSIMDDHEPRYWKSWEDLGEQLYSRCMEITEPRKPFS